MEIVQHPDDIDAWTPAVDEGQQPPVPPAPNAAGLNAPVVEAVQAIATGGSVYLKVIITDPADDSLTPVLHYRVQNDGSGAPGAWVEQAFPDVSPTSGIITLSTSAIPADTVLDVEVAFKGSKGSYSDWSPTETVTTTSDPTPPGVVTGVSVSPSAGAATFNWTAPNSENYVGAKIYIGTTNSFGSATYYPPPEYGAAGANDARTVTGLSAGVKYGWVVSVNGSDIAGSPVATGAFTVT
ncbi:MAG: hypothetical protein J0H80_07375, partial [Rhizobiales bacterium]|nr:hypothetical protein [Hyphomicrobiales bacterium]